MIAECWLKPTESEVAFGWDFLRNIFHFGLDQKIPNFGIFIPGFGIFIRGIFRGWEFFCGMGYPTKKPPLIKNFSFFYFQKSKLMQN